MDRKERIRRHLELLSRELINCETINKYTDLICEDLCVLSCGPKDVYMDWRLDNEIGVLVDADGNKLPELIEHGNLTTGEFVLLELNRMDSPGKIARRIVKYPAPVTFKRGQ